MEELILTTKAAQLKNGSYTGCEVQRWCSPAWSRWRKTKTSRKIRREANQQLKGFFWYKNYNQEAL